MPEQILERLGQFKRCFDARSAGELACILENVSAERFSDPRDLIRLHETLLFLRAYPVSAQVAGLADSILFSFERRVAALAEAGADLTPFEEPDVSGISGTSFSAVFSYEAARSLVARYPGDIEINWDVYEAEKLGSVVRRFIPLIREDWPVEANVPYMAWVRASKLDGESDLQWLLRNIGELDILDRDKSELYEKLQLPINWDLNAPANTRSRLRLPASTQYLHTAPLIRRRDVSLCCELQAPPLPVSRVPRAEAGRMIEMIVDTSAMRYRELYGFNHADTARMYRADAGRGLEIVFFGVPPEWRLPLRAYHAGMFFKNGVPAGYIETLSLFERAEVGFNVYYTFREGESAWIYGRMLRFLRQMLGVTCFSVDPYQLGQANQEGIDSGAFWFYRKLGFRPADPNLGRLVDTEERKIAANPSHKTSSGPLKRLAAGYMLYGDTSSDWDTFRIRNIGLAVQRAMVQTFGGDQERMRQAAAKLMKAALGIDCATDFALAASLIPDLQSWPEPDRRELAAIITARNAPEEIKYLRLLQRHKRLRAAFLNLGA